MIDTGRDFGRGICLVRLSAIGDVAHTLAVVTALRDAFPKVPLTWIVGRTEAPLARLAAGVEVIEVDKRKPVAEALRLRRVLAGRRFDALLHMQVAFRAGLISLAVRAGERIGFDPDRAKELHGLFVNRRIGGASRPGEHVLDGLMRFSAALGVPARPPRWNLAIDEADRRWARETLGNDRLSVVFNVCASAPVRDWPVESYAAVRDHARRRGWRVVLCGGKSDRERAAAARLGVAGDPGVVDAVGRTSLPQLLALLAESTVLVSPDSGPVHMATAVGTPVVGLYAVSNLARTGPYADRRWCVDKRDEAARKFFGRPASELGWREAIRDGRAMSLIDPEDVIERLEAAIAAREPKTARG